MSRQDARRRAQDARRSADASPHRAPATEEVSDCFGGASPATSRSATRPRRIRTHRGRPRFLSRAPRALRIIGPGLITPSVCPHKAWEPYHKSRTIRSSSA
jgi:hypothetical protein